MTGEHNTSKRFLLMRAARVGDRLMDGLERGSCVLAARSYPQNKKIYKKEEKKNVWIQIDPSKRSQVLDVS